MRINRIFPHLFLLVVTWWCLACSDDRIFEEFTEFHHLNWASSDTVTYNISGLKDAQVMSAIGVRYNDDYEFHNLYVRCFLKDSIGQVKQDTLINLPLFNAKTGKPRGRGFGNRLTFYDTLPFNKFEGSNSIQFVQYMRKDTLEGIEAVGLKITNRKN